LTAQSPAPLPLPQPDDWLPRNREEACRIIGASPDASEAVIKKIVDALRQSWHPDHAAGSADQGAREQRMKQINVAWDIISGKRTQH
jgi:DnaJ-class molecular chaperone